MRRKLATGNWKMNGSLAGLDMLADVATAMGSDSAEAVICPPSAYLMPAVTAAQGTSVGIGAQDCHTESKGAFTGAFEDRLGLLEHAHDGTLFLDEVDALSQRAQVSLLRFLQEGEVRPVGGRSTKTINVRVIAASNKNLKTLVKSGTFREDLLLSLIHI